MLRSKEAFYSIKWDFRNWENIFPRKTFSSLKIEMEILIQKIK